MDKNVVKLLYQENEIITIKMRRRPEDLWGRPPPPAPGRPRRPAARAIEELDYRLLELERKLIITRRRDLARLYRALRRDIRRAVAEATGKKLPEPTPEEEEKEEKNFLEKILGIDIDIDSGDILKMGGAAVAGALAVLLVTHWDDIYNYITKAKEEGKSGEELKEGLQNFLQNLLK
ncbi:MAG TPA: hypothetical protein ENG54_00525 [Thermofilum sp.]|nr:hypothetical protein [Thermofilum sp.]